VYSIIGKVIWPKEHITEPSHIADTGKAMACRFFAKEQADMPFIIFRSDRTVESAREFRLWHFNFAECVKGAHVESLPIPLGRRELSCVGPGKGAGCI